MASHVQRRLCVLLTSAAAAFAAWKTVPGSPADRMAFEGIVSTIANPPRFVAGKGSAADPWTLNLFQHEAKPDPSLAPVIVSLGDDLENFFQASPPAPIDFAVLFRNFQRLGATRAASSAVLAWPAPDPIGLAALDKAIQRFDSIVLTAPLSRGAVATPLPPAFRRASVDLKSVTGDTRFIPAVNRLAVPGTILGGENATAGFSFLESNPTGDAPPLLARWDDRVIFAFPVMAVLQQMKLPVEGVEIHLGEFLKLSPQGPIIPIDPYGNLSIPVKNLAAAAEVPADKIVDAPDDLLATHANATIILRDDQTSAEPETRAFSRSVAPTVAALASARAFLQTERYPRPNTQTEWALLSFGILSVTALCGLARFPRHLAFGTLTGATLATQWIGVGALSIWLPGLPILAIIACAALVSPWFRQQTHAPAAAAPEAEPVVLPPAEEIPPAPAAVIQKEPRKKATHTKTPAKKVAAKKAAAKKAAKKTAAKKTAPPRNPRSKEPPGES